MISNILKMLKNLFFNKGSSEKNIVKDVSEKPNKEDFSEKISIEESLEDLSGLEIERKEEPQVVLPESKHNFTETRRPPNKVKINTVLVDRKEHSVKSKIEDPPKISKPSLRSLIEGEDKLVTFDVEITTLEKKKEINQKIKIEESLANT